MYKTINLYIIICIAFVSCTEKLEDIPASKENINGFDVTWRLNVTNEQKNVIREILNNMQYVEGGTFLMGATQEQEPFARENERPAHYVRLSDYYIGKTEITIQQLEVILDKEFSVYERNHGAPKFTWYDWQTVLNLISEYSGVTFDFPTEAQWEYAARGGKNGNGYIYSGGNSISYAEKKENELGLWGMARCHSEWCKDAYNAYSGLPLETNPYHIQGLGHVVRGGNELSMEKLKDYFDTRFSTKDKFFNIYKDSRSCRVSARSFNDDSYVYLGIYISCRFVINLDKQ